MEKPNGNIRTQGQPWKPPVDRDPPWRDPAALTRRPAINTGNPMRFIAITLLAAVSMTTQAKDIYVSPHTTKNGTYVQGHYQTEANSTKLDNYSTKGNYNPYTGKAGTVDPYKADRYSIKPVKPLSLGDSSNSPEKRDE